MRAIGWRLFQGAGDDLRNLLIADRARSPRAWLVVQSVEPVLGKAPTPLADRGGIGPHKIDDRLVLQSIRRCQNNPRPPRQSLRRLSTTRQPFELTPLRLRQGNRYGHSAHRSSLQYYR